MDRTPYRVREGANLALYPRGTKVGDVVRLTAAEALYERDMGRLEPVEEKPAAEVPAEPSAPSLPAPEAPADGGGASAPSKVIKAR